MKKLLAFVLTVTAAGFLFAESFTVKSIKGGVVNYADSNGELKKVTVGLVLDETTQIYTSASSVIVFTTESGKEVKVAGVKKGVALKTFNGPKTPAGKGITSGTVVSNEVAASRASEKGKGTASSRADDVTEQTDWQD